MTASLPNFEKNRWWSDSALSDPDVMVAPILGDPTTLDLIQALIVWGVDRVDAVRAAIAPEMSEAENRILSSMYDPVLEGVRDALERPNMQRAEFSSPTTLGFAPHQGEESGF